MSAKSEDGLVWHTGKISCLNSLYERKDFKGTISYLSEIPVRVRPRIRESVLRVLQTMGGALRKIAFRNDIAVVFELEIANVTIGYYHLTPPAFGRCCPIL